MVTVLATDRNRQALRFQSGDHATGHAVVLRQNRVNVVVVGGQDLFHVLLRIVRLPAVRERFAHDVDRARSDLVTDHFHHAFQQEAGVRVALVAFDDGKVAFAGDGGHRFRDDAANALVVERQVEGTRVFDQAVIADDRDAFVVGLVHCGADCVLVHRQDDQRVCALGDQRFNVGQLLGCRGLRVCRDVLGAQLFQLGLDRGFVGFPALFLEVRPAHAHGYTVAVRVCDRCGRHGECSCQGSDMFFHDVLPKWGPCHTRLNPLGNTSGSRLNLKSKLNMPSITARQWRAFDLLAKLIYP